MAKDTESHAIRLLQEMRSEMQGMRAEINQRFDEIDTRFDDVDTRIDGLTHMIVLLSANMGGHGDRIDAVEARVDALEDATT